MAETPERHAAAAHAAAVRARTACSRRCAARTARRSTSASSTGSAPRCPTPRSPPTSSSGFPGETDEDFRADARRRRAGAVRRRVHVPVLQAPRHPGRRRWTTRCRRPSCRSATSGSSPLVRRHRLGGEQAARRPRRVELLVAEGEGRKDAATHRLTGRARDNRLVHFAAPPDQDVRARRPRRGRGHLRRAAPPGLRRPVRYAGRGPATPGRPDGHGRPPSRASMLGLPGGAPAPLAPVTACG